MGSDDETIRLWDVGTGKNEMTLVGHTEWVQSIAFSPDGKTLASGGAGKHHSFMGYGYRGKPRCGSPGIQIGCTL